MDGTDGPKTTSVTDNVIVEPSPKSLQYGAFTFVLCLWKGLDILKFTKTPMLYSSGS